MYYRLINLKTKKPMKIGNNNRTIEEVREDLLLYLSLDQDVTTFSDKSFDDILEAANVVLISQETPFEDESPIADYLVVPTEKKEAYKPAGRIAHVSNYYN